MVVSVTWLDLSDKRRGDLALPVVSEVKNFPAAALMFELKQTMSVCCVFLLVLVLL